MRFYCRVHGEMLLRSHALACWVCPEKSICGTYVSDEAEYFLKRKR